MTLEDQVMYMGKSKRNLILAAAILNIIECVSSLVLSIIMLADPEFATNYAEIASYFALSTSVSSSLIYYIVVCALGIVGSVLLLYSVREKGKYFRSSQGLYIAGFVIVIFCGGWLVWLLLFISMFMPDIVVMNTREELRSEEKMQARSDAERERAYEEKKEKIEELKRLRDNGIITEEEYKERLFEIL